MSDGMAALGLRLRFGSSTAPGCVSHGVVARGAGLGGWPVRTDGSCASLTNTPGSMGSLLEASLARKSATRLSRLCVGEDLADEIDRSLHLVGVSRLVPLDDKCRAYHLHGRGNVQEERLALLG